VSAIFFALQNLNAAVSRRSWIYYEMFQRVRERVLVCGIITGVRTYSAGMTVIG
jgi:hypothetical protein